MKLTQISEPLSGIDGLSLGGVVVLGSTFLAFWLLWTLPPDWVSDRNQLSNYLLNDVVIKLGRQWHCILEGLSSSFNSSCKAREMQNRWFTSSATSVLQLTTHHAHDHWETMSSGSTLQRSSNKSDEGIK